MEESDSAFWHLSVFNYIFSAPPNFIEERVKRLAAQFEVSSSTVLYWASGNSNPSPLVKNQILKTIRKNIEEEI
jgi:hypothetical protein